MPTFLPETARMIRFSILFLVPGLFFLSFAAGQEAKRKGGKKKTPSRPFSWVSPLSEAAEKGLPKGVKHATFKSPSMGIDVGYYIYLPPGYEAEENAPTRYPVVFHLHGGRPGGESKSVKLARFVDRAIAGDVISPTIYVWPNGGPMSWYNYPKKENGMGEDVFVKELVPHIDKTYRTTGSRSSS